MLSPPMATTAVASAFAMGFGEPSPLAIAGPVGGFEDEAMKREGKLAGLSLSSLCFLFLIKLNNSSFLSRFVEPRTYNEEINVGGWWLGFFLVSCDY